MPDRSVSIETIRRIPSACGGIFSALVPIAQQTEIAKLLAESILVAHQTAPDRWGLRLRTDSMMLKVGFVAAFQCDGDGVLFIADRMLMPRPPKGVLFNQEYRNAQGAPEFRASWPDFMRHVKALHAPHLSGLRIAAAGRRHTTTAVDHSPGLVTYIAAASGVTLPQPIYAADDDFRLPEEPAPTEVFEEGAVAQVVVNRYERDPEARRRCIDHYGTKCAVCGLTLAERYGADLHGCIHVHHLKPLYAAEGATKIDPIADMRPVCPNCHYVIHLTYPQRTIEDVQRLLAAVRG